MNERTIAIIPAFNEAKLIGAVVTRTRPHVRQVVVIDDGSTDNTGEVARAAGANVIRHPQNRGKGASILTGFDQLRESGADYAVFLDADGQHDPNEIPKFVEKADQSNAGIVVGSRMSDAKDMPRVRLWTNQFTSWVASKLARQPLPDSQCGYRLVRRSVIGDLRLETSRFETETEMLIQAGRAGHPIESIPVKTIYIAGRESHIHPLRDALRFFKLAAKYW